LSKLNKYGSVTGVVLAFILLQTTRVGVLDRVVETWPSVPYPAQLLFFGFFCAWATFAWAEDILRTWKQEWPDFDIWDNEEQFRLWEAAALWVDETPRRPPGRREKRQFEVLARAVTDRTLDVIRGTLAETIEDAIDETDGKAVKVNPEWVVKREDLVSFAESRHETPRFLYPKERI
jgi:hypothetical protein